MSDAWWQKKEKGLRSVTRLDTDGKFSHCLLLLLLLLPLAELSLLSFFLVTTCECTSDPTLTWPSVKRYKLNFQRFRVSARRRTRARATVVIEESHRSFLAVRKYWDTYNSDHWRKCLPETNLTWSTWMEESLRWKYFVRVAGWHLCVRVYVCLVAMKTNWFEYAGWGIEDGG